MAITPAISLRNLFCGLFLWTIFFVPLLHAQKSSKPALPAADEACLSCHGQPGMKSEKGRDITVNPEKHAAGVHGILACKDCHTSIKEFPHPEKIRKVECKTCHQEQSAAVPASIHGALGEAACSSCHGNVHEVTAAAILPAKCADCHAQEIKDFESSAHGAAAKAGDPDAPTCKSCHGEIHQILSSGETKSPVARKNQAEICARCHADPGFVSRHKIPVQHPVEQYLQSAHRRAILDGKNGPACSDCHGSHEILSARDSHSKVSRWNIAGTCGACHKEIAKTFSESVHGEALKSGVRDAPDCTACHGEHLILSPTNANSPVNSARVSTETCGRCHGDARLVSRYGLPADRVPSYAESFHGLAVREGSIRAANCASCHGVHNIFRSSDPRSTVNAANLATTCGKCHTGMGDAKFTIGPVHVQTAQGPAHPAVEWIRRIYWLLIPLTLAFMVIHNLLDLLAKMRRPRQIHTSGQMVVRMNLWFRIAHWGVMLSFPTLVFTGFALKFPDSVWAKPFLLWEGHIAFRGGLHRAAAVVLVAATLYHFVHLAANRRDRAFLAAMLPKWRDARDLAGVFLFNLGLRKESPKFEKFNYAEKLEYWAFLWGTAVMAISGFLLWFNNFTLRHFPKWMADAATAVHWYEALLATFSILLWHFYMVVFDPLVYPMDLAWLNGKIDAEHCRESRPEYFEKLTSSVPNPAPEKNEAPNQNEDPSSGKE